MSIKKVIENNCCIGCGLCTINGNYKVTLNDFGMYEAKPEGKSFELESSLCPFSADAKGTNEMSHQFLKTGELHYSSRSGFYDKLFIGHVKDHSIHENSTSGGILSWLLIHLFDTGKIDGVIHVVPVSTESKEVLYNYGLSSSREEVLNGAKSRYYPATLADIWSSLKPEKKYAFVGVPCFVRGIRLYTALAAQIKIDYVFSIICGHYKSTKYAELIACQVGVDMNDVTGFNFRHTFKNISYRLYGNKIEYNNNGTLVSVITPQSKKLYGTGWGTGYFKYKACDYCDDVMGENGDAVFGDAWIEPYSSKSFGSNIIISRNREITRILESHPGELLLEEVSLEDGERTQEASFRHRQECIAYRKKITPGWTPETRFSLRRLSLKTRLIQRQRVKLRERSHRAFQESQYPDKIKEFISKMEKSSFFYRLLYGGPIAFIPYRIKSFLKRLLSKLSKK